MFDRVLNAPLFIDRFDQFLVTVVKSVVLVLSVVLRKFYIL